MKKWIAILPGAVLSRPVETMINPTRKRVLVLRNGPNTVPVDGFCSYPHEKGAGRPFRVYSSRILPLDNDMKVMQICIR